VGVAVCDTVVVTREAGGGRALFAKNSDREPDEAQLLEAHHGADHAAGTRLRCTYIEVPQALHTHAVLLSRPYWMWGAEMGANEHGLVVGNEAVFTRAPPGPPALLGMDLLRLVLERAAGAESGVGVLTALLEEHGQGGPAGHRDKRFTYDNSFILADPEDAWVVETAGRAWVAARVRGVRAISNALSVRDRYDRASPGLQALARDMGLAPGKGRVDFTEVFARKAMGFAGAAWGRRSCLERLATSAGPQLGAAGLMAALRHHGHDDPHAGPGGLRMSVCAHATWLPTRTSQTTASWVSDLGDRPIHFATGTAAPCTSVFKPLWIDTALAGTPAGGGETFDPASPWWRHEPLHRRALVDLPSFLRRFAPARDALEAGLVTQALEARSMAPDRRAAVTREAFHRAEALDFRTVSELGEGGPLPGVAHRRHWRKLDVRSRLAAV
jgi:dipeptidase